MTHENKVLLKLLESIDLGSSIAETDELLEAARVETSAFTDLLTDKVDLIPGTKGSGKSALFRMFTDFLPAYLLEKRKVVVAHGVQKQGDVIFQAFKEEFDKLSEDDFVDFWCIYLVSLAHEQFIKGEIYSPLLKQAGDEIEAFRRACVRANIPEIKAKKSFVEVLEWVLAALKSYAPRLKYNLPHEAGELELDLFGNPAAPIHKKHSNLADRFEPPSYVLDIKKRLEDILAKSGVSIWLMVDKLDELFPRRSAVESRALRGLLRTMRLFATKEIRVKVFLRDDMLDNLFTSGEGFTALTHVTARQANTLTWSEDQLLTMIVNRFYANSALSDYFGVNQKHLVESLEYRRAAFAKLFPPTVHKGARQSSTLRWIYSHACDAKGVVTPRDVIDLLTKAKQRQQDEFSANLVAESDYVISSSAILYGYEKLSEKKRVTYLRAEFPHLWPSIEKFIGGKSSYSETGMQKVLGNNWKSIIADFLSIGLISERESGGEKFYWFPFLYRRGLEITQGSDDQD